MKLRRREVSVPTTVFATHACVRYAPPLTGGLPPPRSSPPARREPLRPLEMPPNREYKGGWRYDTQGGRVRGHTQKRETVITTLPCCGLLVPYTEGNVAATAVCTHSPVQKTKQQSPRDNTNKRGTRIKGIYRTKWVCTFHGSDSHEASRQSQEQAEHVVHPRP